MEAPARARGGRATVGASACALLVLAVAIVPLPRAAAVILPPQSIDGPSSAILELGGVAMAPDGTGGLAYTKAVDGVPHVFVSRYAGGRWGAPVRADWDQPFEATQPRIAAEGKGRLMVVWATPVATVHGAIRRGLFSATMGPGSTGFGPALLVDQNVGDGAGLDPSLAGVAAGQATVAYRVVTNDFSVQSSATTAVQLRPGDVMADIRVARFKGDRWSQVGPVNRNPASSMRPPTTENAPRVGIGSSGNAVVAWQEPDQTGVARVWVRRIFGSTPGPAMPASPPSWEGKAVSGDADAFALDVTPLDRARVVSRVTAGGALATSRLFLSALGPGFAEGAAKLSGPEPAEGGAPPLGPLGVPALAAGDGSGGEGPMRLVFTAGGQARQVGLDKGGHPVSIPFPDGPGARPEGEAIAAVGPEGGGLGGYVGADAEGAPVVALRQEFPSGAVQTAQLSGLGGGPISPLEAAQSGLGDALVAFRQGEPGDFEVVATRVSAPPAEFSVSAPGRWVRPRGAKLRWQAAPSAVGGVSYAVVIDGHVIRRGLSQRQLRPRPALLGSGVRQVRVLATDALGGQLLSGPAKLRVDARPPSARVRLRGERATVRLSDPGSGVKRARCFFGDRSRFVRAKRVCRHRYSRAGRYEIAVQVVDRAGNRAWRRLAVRAR